MLKGNSEMRSANVYLLLPDWLLCPLARSLVRVADTLPLLHHTRFRSTAAGIAGCDRPIDSKYLAHFGEQTLIDAR